MSDWIRISEKDHVIVVLRPYAAGETITLEAGANIEVKQDIEVGHKIATTRIHKGKDVFKYGYPIGYAALEIKPGEWVHTHNLSTKLSGITQYQDQLSFMEQEPRHSSHRTFQGYVRKDGSVGIRNEIWIINTVGCINKTCEILAKQGNTQYGHQVDGIYHFAHPYGCSQLGDDLAYTTRLLASLIRHPNAAGVLVVGLGCENNQIQLLQKELGEFDPLRIKFMHAQQEEDELEKGLLLIGELAEQAALDHREPLPISKLCIGLKCGGSDGLSGITANPLVGTIADHLIAEGGSAILTEVPEMFGAETLLMNRAVNEEVHQLIVNLINHFKHYFIRHGQEIYENPSPGNKAGGITTLEEKSLGCTQKGGTSPVMGVARYGELIHKAGLHLLEAPGNDLVSVTALSAAGAHLVLFTTGRGTPFGGPVPTLKISTNSTLAAHKPHWIDYNAGQLYEGKSMLQMRDELWERIIAIASGEATAQNEKQGYKEIAIFKDGVTL